MSKPRELWPIKEFTLDIDKLVIFFKSVGFPAAVAVWFLYKIQVFMDSLLVNSTAQIELLRQILALHNK